jgi:mannose-1-phosphate guanylyltransferase
MKAMILAAGFGTRLHPYSLVRPKPLFPLLNTPLIIHTLQRLQDAGFTEIGVNCHYLASQIIEQVQGIQGVTLFPEEDVLGTGGGLKNAADWFGSESVLIVNGDIYHDFDFNRIWRHHKQQSCLATLVCHDFPRFNKISLDDSRQILQFSPCDEAADIVAFTGVHVLEPQALSVVRPGFSSIIDCYCYWIERGEMVQTMMVQDHFWMDMGTPADYLALHECLLRQAKSPFLVHPSVNIDDVVLHDWVSVGENAVLGKGCQLERVVVWDGGIVEPGVYLKDAIIT